jgi:hypothetical protein
MTSIGAVKDRAPRADGCDARHVQATTTEKGPGLMDMFLSWARSTVANMEHTLGRSERYFDRILVGVLVALAIAIAFLFLQAG